MNLLPFLPRFSLLLESQSKSFVLCVYHRFLLWILMHLGLEFRAGDAKDANSVPWLQSECPHSWIWHKAAVSMELLCSQQCRWPSPALAPALREVLPSLPDLLVPQE